MAGKLVVCVAAATVWTDLMLSPLTAEPINIDETEKVVAVTLPGLTNKWVKRGEERASQSVMLLSGVAPNAGDGVSVQVDPDSQQQTQMTMDWMTLRPLPMHWATTRSPTCRSPVRMTDCWTRVSILTE